MRLTRRFSVCVAAALLAAGCVGSPGRSPFADQGADRTPSWFDPALAASGSRAEHNSAAAVDGELIIPDDVGPEHYVELALRRNPAIRAARQKVSRLSERIPQATSLPDPMLTLSPIGEMAETAAGQMSLMAGVSQKLPYPGKLEARGRIAAQGVAMAAQDLEATRLAVMADTRQAFWSYYFAVRAIEVTDQSRTLLDQFRTIAQSKNKVGTATQQDVLRASVELSNLDNELITWRQRQTTAVAMLNSLLDRPVTASLPKPQALQLRELTLELETLLAEAGRSNPMIRKVHERIDAGRQRLALAKLNRKPDLVAMANYTAVDDQGLAPMANGKDQWWLGFGLNLPIWTGKLDAAENEARRGILEGLADLNNAHNRIAFSVQDALVKVETQQRLVILFRDVIAHQADQTVEASFAGYRTGTLDFLTLVSNWRKLLDFQLTYHRNLAQLEKDFAQLQEAVGVDLTRQVNPGAAAGESESSP